jgi:hypothetical protein
MKGVFNTKTWNSESTTVYKSDLETTTVNLKTLLDISSVLPV